jgi:pimeloyl-ACP methyl ester carboxylesterase
VHYAALAGCQLAYTRQGTAPRAFVFLHGGASNHEDWQEQYDQLDDEFTVVGLDHRGHGKTRADDPTTSTIPRLAADAIELMDRLAIERAVFVGHSFGTRVALKAAIDYPDRTAGVVLVDGSRVWRGERDVVRQSQEVQFADLLAAYRKIFEESFFEGGDPAIRARLMPLIDDCDAIALETIARSTGEWDSAGAAAQLGGIDSPVLAIQTTYVDYLTTRYSLPADTLTTPYLDFLRDHLKHLQVRIVPGYGHYVQLEAPTLVNDILRAFAQSIPW